MDAKCAHHPDRAADGGTCERCGTFVCDACAVSGSAPAICQPCLSHLDSGEHVKHARVLSILLMIHGALLLAMGGYYVLFGGFMLDAMLDIPVEPTPGDPSPDLLPSVVMGAFGFIGVSHLLPGALQALAGWRLLRFRGVALAWIAVAAGMLSVFGCYCAPTGFAIGAYAIFVLTRDDVRARFAVRVPHAIDEP